jgi:vitamin B12 transporter
MKKHFFVLAATIFGSQLQAQDSSAQKQLEEVIVTANRYPQKQSETGKIVTVITHRELESSSGKTLPEILNTVAGISISGANNNPGSIQTLNIRGTSAGNALILIDGVPVNDPSVIYNYFDLNLLPVDQIERIEILKGGQSTLYGSDAVAGVVNIITRKTNNKKLGLHAGVEGGSYGTVNSNAGIEGQSSILQYSLQYSNKRSDGFSSAYDSTGIKHFDNDGYRQNTVNGKLGFVIHKKLQVSVQGQYSKYKTDLDAGAFTDERDYSSSSKNVQAGAGFVYPVQNGAIHLNYQYNNVTRTYLNDSGYRSDPSFYYSSGKYVGSTHYAELYGNSKWKNFEWLAGIDFRNNATNQDYFSMSTYGPFASSLTDSLAHMQQTSPYTSFTFKGNEKFSVELGGRWNHHSIYGNNFTYTFNPYYYITQHIKIFTNFYSAFKTPSLYQLFDPYSGNKKLQPEKSNVIEGGFTASLPQQFWMRAVYFNIHTKNSIQYITVDPVNYISNYNNISEQKSYGLELELSKSIGHFNFAANYTYTDGSTKSGYDPYGNKLSADTSYNNLYHIPKNAFNLRAALAVNKHLTISSSLRAISKRWELVYGSSAPTALASYYTLDVFGAYQFNKAFSIYLNLKNISNQEYFDLLGYNSRRFNFMTGIRINL